MFDETKVREQIEDLAVEEKIAMWNEYCEQICYAEDIIEENDLDKLFELLEGKPSEVASIVCTNAYNPYDDYVCFDGYGKLKSFSYINEYNSPFEMDDLVKWVVDNEDTLGYFDTYEVEEDEEDGDE